MFIATLLIKLINFIIGLIEVFIGFRIILKLTGANPTTPFVAWIFEISRSLIWPFQNMFPSPNLNGRALVEFDALIALIAYAFIGYLLLAFIGAIESRFIPYSRKKTEDYN